MTWNDSLQRHSLTNEPKWQCRTYNELSQFKLTILFGYLYFQTEKSKIERENVDRVSGEYNLSLGSDV